MLADDNKSLETYQKLLDLLPSSSGMDHVAVAMEMAKVISCNLTVVWDSCDMTMHTLEPLYKGHSE